MEEIYEIIRLNIINIRKKNKDSQEELARKLGMSRGYISQIESQKVKNGISLETIYKIAQVYNVDFVKFFKKPKNINNK